MERAKKIISYILAIVLTMLISAAFLLISVNFTILNKDNVKKQLHEVDYSYRICDIIVDSTNDYILQSGFDESILSKDFIRQEAQTDISNVMDSIYYGAELKVSSDEIKQKLYENIEKYIAENDYEVSEETRNDIETFKTTIVDKYEKNVVYAKDSIQEIANYVQKAKRIVLIAIIVVTVLAIIIAIVMFKLHKPAIATSLLATGIMFTAVKFYSEINIAVNNILILNRPFSDFIIRLVKQVLQSIMIAGIVFIVFGLVLAVIFEIKSKRYNGDE